MSLNDVPPEGASSNSAATATAASGELLLACTLCRNRKLRCDRLKPACTRCSRLKTDCVYPESRRKPAFKRRNVKELEARLAQVEVLLKEAAGSKPDNPPQEEEKADETTEFNFAEPPVIEDVFLQGLDFTQPMMTQDDDQMFSAPGLQTYPMPSGPSPEQNPNNYFGGELMDMGITEPLPPFEVMEELNKIFFEHQAHFIPIIHHMRYLQSFYSPPHMRPPMCLQYAIWALASNGHEKYAASHDIFYKRARQYAEADEMKGYGEHFITVAHAQAWCLITTDEAKSMLFTRASMSAARAVRLVEMLGLHRLDSLPDEISPTLLPPADWQELEERRRAFWGVFCIDSHCSLSTGWPHLIDVSEVTTHLPAQESAFQSGTEVETCRLDEAFKGFSYSSFAGTVLICDMFNQILKHVHRPKLTDKPQNYEYGGFWQRHREIDNTLSSAFMFLPEGFRLPQNYRDPTAVHTNLNLHASVICLHHAAIEKIDKHNLPEHVKKASQNRLSTAAQEIVNIIKLTTSVSTNPKSPLAALSLYCAASVYIYQCKDTQSPTNIDNLDFIIAAMDAIGREHVITRAFLKQVVLDIERNDLRNIIKLPTLDRLPPGLATGNHNIPLLVRSNVARHSEMQPPLPGRLPLGKPKGFVSNNKMKECGISFNHGIDDVVEIQSVPLTEPLGASECKRTSQTMGPGSTDSSFWSQNRMFDQVESSSSVPSPPEMNFSNTTPPQDQNAHVTYQASNNSQFPFAAMTLPHRTGSPAMSPLDTHKGVNVGQNMVEQNGIGQAGFATAGQGLGPSIPSTTTSMAPPWDMANNVMYGQFTTGGQLGSNQEPDPWSILGQNDNVDWNALAANAVAANIHTGRKKSNAA